jgi:hypothetical protein
MVARRRTPPERLGGEAENEGDAQPEQERLPQRVAERGAADESQERRIGRPRDRRGRVARTKRPYGYATVPQAKLVAVRPAGMKRPTTTIVAPRASIWRSASR